MPRANKGLSTRSVHGGEHRDKPFSSVTNPIVQTSTYVFQNTQELIDYTTGKVDREEYGRYGNPTKSVAERKIAELEGGECRPLFFRHERVHFRAARHALLRRSRDRHGRVLQAQPPVLQADPSEIQYRRDLRGDG